jgi:hypothetical protein
MPPVPLAPFVPPVPAPQGSPGHALKQAPSAVKAAFAAQPAVLVPAAQELQALSSAQARPCVQQLPLRHSPHAPVLLKPHPAPHASPQRWRLQVRKAL